MKEVKNYGYVYPERSDEHMIKVKHLRDCNFDENYNYYNTSLKVKFKRSLLWLLLNTVVFLVVRIRHGVRLHGKKNIRKNKKLLKDGAITICNHVFMWDYLCVLMTIKPRLQRHIAWKINFEGPNGPLIDWVGGVPVPTDNVRAMVKFKRAKNQILQDKVWLHVFPEGSMWFYYPGIRPLKPAVFKFAVTNNKPVIPYAFTFRERKGIFRIFSKNPFVDLHVGEPILPDTTLPQNEAVEKMHKEAYRIMQELAGILPGNPLYNENQNIDEYKKIF